MPEDTQSSSLVKPDATHFPVPLGMGMHDYLALQQSLARSDRDGYSARQDADEKARKIAQREANGGHVKGQPRISAAVRIQRLVGDDAKGLHRDFPNRVPAKLFCTDNPKHGLVVRAKASALEHRHISVNASTSLSWMPHDIDRSDAYFAHRDANLPEPNVIMINPKNGHGHAAYLLKTPVHKYAAANPHPLRFFAATERGVGRRIGADKGYTGLIVKNPLHLDWRTEWRRDEPYTLEEIADCLFKHDMRPDYSEAPASGIGRAVTLFDQVRHRAYRAIRDFQKSGGRFNKWQDWCLDVAGQCNQKFDTPLPFSEVRSAAKSVATWTWRNCDKESFSQKQSERGQASAAVRWAGHVSIDKTVPWVAMGISRATYFRRKAAGTL